MTREEFIARLKKLIEEAENDERTAESVQNVPNGDLISRKAAIDALEELKIRYFDRKVIIEKTQDVINNLPAAQPEERTNERTETHACDCISRQKARLTMAW